MARRLFRRDNHPGYTSASARCIVAQLSRQCNWQGPWPAKKMARTERGCGVPARSDGGKRPARGAHQMTRVRPEQVV